VLRQPGAIVGLAEALESAARDDGAHDAALQGGRNAERIRESVEKPHIAKFYKRRGEPEPLEPLEGEAQDFGVGGRAVGTADRLDAGLQELTGLALA
jgi:hypothetical protein